MEINGTLIVQGVNFFIVYVLLRTLLFKPALAYIHAQDEQQKTLRTAIHTRTVVIENKTQELQARWRAFHDSHRDALPRDGDHTAPTQTITISPQAFKPLEHAQADQLTQQLSTVLVQEIVRDNN